MALSVQPVNTPTLNQSAPVQQPTITGPIVATPGSNGFAGLTQPAAPASSTPATTTTTTRGSTTASTATPISASTIAAIQAAIQGAIANNNATAQNAQIANAGADANEQGQYLGQEQTNNAARGSAIQNADQAAATGNQGLKAVLASLGALGGTGQVLAGRAVADSANSDIGGADSTYTNNNQAIQNANNDYYNQKVQRDNALAANLKTDNADASTQGYQDLLNDAETQGDTATYQKFLPSLVAAATQPTQSLLPTPLTYTSAPTSAYAPGSSQNVTTAATAPGAAASQVAAQNAVTPVNSALYTTKTNG